MLPLFTIYGPLEASSGPKFMLKSYEWSPVWNIRFIYWTFWPRPLSPPSAPCKLSSLGRAHHSTILAISVLKSTTMISRFGSKNAFPSSEKMINYVSGKSQWFDAIGCLCLINLNININISKSIRMNTNINISTTIFAPATCRCQKIVCFCSK